MQLPMNPEIRTFLESYRDAFNRLDGKAVASLYAIPSGIVTDRGYVHWPSRQPIIENMNALCQLYQDNGFTAASYEVASFIDQGTDFAVIDLSWTIQRSHGQEPWRFNTTYNLIRSPEGWRVLLCTAYQEKRLNE